MALDKCELSPELLLNVSLQFFYFSVLFPGHLLLMELMCFFMPSPPVLQEHHFIQSDGGCSHGGSQDFCEDILPLLHGDHQASLSPLPHRNLSLPLHLWASSQPEGVAKPRGTTDVGGGDGMLSRHQTLPLLPLWDSYPPVHSCEGFDPKCPDPGALSAGV